MAIVTLSGGTFSGGRELARAVSERLGCKLVSRDSVIEKTARYGISKSRVARARRRHLGMLHRMDLRWRHYLVLSRAALSKEIHQGSLVYLGDNGRASLHDFPNVLNVRVDADMEYRIENLVRRTDYVINAPKARQLIDKMDDKKARWRKVLYGDGRVDNWEPDLVVEPGRTGIPDACEIIAEILEHTRYRTTARSLEVTELLTIAAELRARIAMDPEVVDDDVAVEVRDGLIAVTGSVRSHQDLEAIKGMLY